jgi:UDP-N-acetylglucosamine 1-carboxyvinyltransferase
MSAFIIEGGHPLKGDITPQGAKNEALQVLCATLLTSEPVRISNIPDIADVANQIRLLEDIGVKVTRHSRSEMTFQADALNPELRVVLIGGAPCPQHLVDSLKEKGIAVYLLVFHN